MGKPYSLDLRERIAGYVREGHSARAAGRLFGRGVDKIGNGFCLRQIQFIVEKRPF